MIPIIIVVVAIALIWGALFLRWFGMFGSCLGLLIVASCLGYDFFHVKIGPIPFSADRVMLGLLFGIYVCQRIRQVTQHKPLDRVDILLGAYIAALTVSTLLHDWRWKDSQPLASLLFMYLLPAVAYWLVRDSFTGDRAAPIFLAFFAAFGVYLGFTAILEVMQVYSLVFPQYIVTSKYTEWMGRARGPFLNPATNGMFLSTSLFAWSMWWPHVGRLGKSVVLGGMLLTILGVVLTLTRSCWLGAAAGLAMIVFASMQRQLKMPTLAIGILLGALLLVVGKDSLNSFKRDKAVSQYYMEQSAKLRPILAAVAWRIFQDHPLFGCGYGQYKRIDIDYLRDPTTDLPLEQAKGYVQHNLFLGILVDTGLLGLGLYLATLGGWGWHAWRLWSSPRLPLFDRQLGLLMLACLTQWAINGMFHDVALPSNANLLTFFTAGVCQGAWALHQSTKSSERDLLRPSATRAGAATNQKSWIGTERPEHAI